MCSLFHVCFFYLLVLKSATSLDRQKRLLPNNQLCDPFTSGSCAKGDFIDTNIADCQYVRTASHPISCTAQGDTGKFISWVVAPEKNNLCKPKSTNVKFICGAAGTNTRCVCSDYKIKWNSCCCQYWTSSTPGENQPGYCTTHYRGGESSVHHYTCCNNCYGTTSPTCDKMTYQGGSTESYCGHCGKPTGGGLWKWYFNCVNCTVQSYCESYCNKKVSTRPGFCWKWADCFKGCCIKASKHNNSLNGKDFNLVFDDELGFCGDGVCQGIESPSNCPSDCCYKINNSTCPAIGCSPSCCQDSKCCLF